MNNENDCDPQGLVFTPKWSFDFADDMYYQSASKFAQAKAEFDNKASRIEILKYPGYHVLPKPEIWAGMYGSMLKRALGSTDPIFAQQGDNIGIVFELFEKDGMLKLNAFGTDNERKALEGTKLPSSGNLHGLLKGNMNPNHAFYYTKLELLGLLGYKSTLPACSEQGITLYPVITSVTFQGSVNNLFSLACELPPMPGNKGNSAYAPPCPPFCYP
ncbi:MAG: hypothetical protein LCH81_02725 [Bacteroidetes bacterium]|nr:hypothetical protein [Bacteroidota bacterium]